MRAAQQQRAHPLFAHRRKVFLRRGGKLLIARCGVPRLHKAHEVLTGYIHDLPAGAQRLQPAAERAAFYACAGGDHAQRRIARHGGQLLHRRIYHVVHRQAEARQNVGRGAGHGAACGNYRLCPEGGGKLHILPRHAPQLLLRPHAVGVASGVAEVYYVFIRQKRSQRPERRQPAQPGINGSVVHLLLHYDLNFD